MTKFDPTKPVTTRDWQQWETAPKDGTIFLALSVLQDNFVISAFYQENKSYNAVKPVVLSVFVRPGRYASAVGWFVPTHWAALEPPQ